MKRGNYSHSIAGKTLHPFKDGQLIIEVCNMQVTEPHCVQGVFLKLFIRLREELYEGDEVDEDEERMNENRVLLGSTLVTEEIQAFM